MEQKSKKIRIAFIKYGGLASSGTEKFLQNVAILLPKDRFEVDYFYCDAGPYIGSNFKHPNTDPLNLEPMKIAGVNLIEFTVGNKDVTKRDHPWVNTNFWNLFDESKYDLLQTGRAGNPEYPFTKICKIPIIDSIHVMGGVDNQFNISRVMHITKWSADKWITRGGDKRRVRIISHPMVLTDNGIPDLKLELNIQNHTIFGFHQRVSDEIFSDIPLNAYKKIESEDTYFIIMGGSSRYRLQAQELGIRNIIFIDHSGDRGKIYSFLKTLDVYAHGRKDGELNSTAMAEALFFGKPIISHTSRIHNGHIECIGNAGIVAETETEYTNALLMCLDEDFRKHLSSKALVQFEELYKADLQMKNIIEIYEDAFNNPFPNKVSRIISSLRLRFYAYKILQKLKFVR